MRRPSWRWALAVALVLAALVAALMVWRGSQGSTAGTSGTGVTIADIDPEGVTALSGQADGQADDDSPDTDDATMPGSSQMALLASRLEPQAIDDDYRTGYEVLVYSFCDSDGNGIGDLAGLTSELDYISGEDGLCADELWVLPIFSSPTYHKYDVASFEDVDEDYGTLADFTSLADACHERGVRLILDLPLNHTSVEHPWFTAAADYLRALPEGAEPNTDDCPYVGYYNFSREAQDGYAQLAGTSWYYEARFWEGMPDLNLASDAVRDEIARIVELWLDRGADGFRLDAVTSYFTGDDDANIAFLAWLSGVVRAADEDAYLVGEAWEAQDTYARYYESGIDSLFDFAFAGSWGTVHEAVMGNMRGWNLAVAYASEEALYAEHSAVAGTVAVNAPFYTNHDMDRNASYYEDEGQVKLALALNLLGTGNAFVYYGEELGMPGAADDAARRAAMAWGDGADGMCDGPEGSVGQELAYGTLADQQGMAGSVYEYVRCALRIRRSLPALARGTTTVVDGLSGDDVGAFVRSCADGEWQDVLVVINLSAEPREVSLAGDAKADGFGTLVAVLCVGEDDEVTLDGQTLTLPGRGIALLVKA